MFIVQREMYAVGAQQPFEIAFQLDPRFKLRDFPDVTIYNKSEPLELTLAPKYLDNVALQETENVNLPFREQDWNEEEDISSITCDEQLKCARRRVLRKRFPLKVT